MKIEKIELEKSNGIYLLTKEAVNIIKHAKSLVVSFQTKNGHCIENECWFRVWTKENVYGVDIELGFDMPINVYNVNKNSFDWSFKSITNTSVSYQTSHPILELVKPKNALYFRPSPNATTGILSEKGLVEDVLFWQVDTGKKMIEGIFDRHICEPNASSRLIKKLPVMKVELSN